MTSSSELGVQPVRLDCLIRLEGIARVVSGDVYFLKWDMSHCRKENVTAFYFQSCHREQRKVDTAEIVFPGKQARSLAPVSGVLPPRHVCPGPPSQIPHLARLHPGQ